MDDEQQISSNIYMDKIERKSIVETVLYILGQTGGTDIYHILKILYFAEQKHLARWGMRMTSDSYCAMQYGPVAYELYGAFRRTSSCDHELSEMLQQAIKCADVDASSIYLPCRNANMDYISVAAKECLDESILENQNLTFNELLCKSHDDAWKAARNRDGQIMDIVSMAKAGHADSSTLAYLQEQESINKILA